MAESITGSVLGGRFEFSGPNSYTPAEQYMRSVDTYPRMPNDGVGAITINFSPPLWLTKADSTHVIVSSGTVNGIIPTNAATNLSISSDATWNIYLDATVDATTGAVSAVTITASTSAVPSDTSTHAYRLIGTTVRAAGAITTTTPMLAWSQEFVACTPGTTSSFHWVVA